MTDPKSGADCIRHCRDVLTDDEWRLAVALIELYAHTRMIAGIDEVRAIYDKVFLAPITAAESAQAEDVPT